MFPRPDAPKGQLPPFIMGPGGFTPYVPSPPYLASVFLAHAEEEAEDQETYMSCLGGTMLKVDHTFQVG
jgi:hypothetical protein